MANSKHKRPKTHLSLVNEFIPRIGFAVWGFPLATLWYHCCELMLQLSRRDLKQGRGKQADRCTGTAFPLTVVEGVFQRGCATFHEGMPFRNVLHGSSFWKSRGRGCYRESAGASSPLPILAPPLCDVPAMSGDVVKKISAVFSNIRLSVSQGKGRFLQCSLKLRTWKTIT